MTPGRGSSSRDQVATARTVATQCVEIALHELPPPRQPASRLFGGGARRGLRLVERRPLVLEVRDDEWRRLAPGEHAEPGVLHETDELREARREVRRPPPRDRHR